MKKYAVVQGQLSLWDLPKEDKEECKVVQADLSSIIEKYKHISSRIVKTSYGALLIELEDRTLYYSSSGINEFDLSKDVGLTPADEILIAQEEKEATKIQLARVEELKVDKYIKRRGDRNIIVPGETTKVITPFGWIIEYKQKPVYKDDELRTLPREEPWKVGDLVEFEHNGNQQGKIFSIYNNGHTVNVIWDNKHTAVCINNLIKIQS